MTRRLLLLLAVGAALALPSAAFADPAPPAPTSTTTVPASVPGVQVGPTLPTTPGGAAGGGATVNGDQASHPHFWDLPGRIKQSITTGSKGSSSTR
jgi:hypothetical protein